MTSDLLAPPMKAKEDHSKPAVHLDKNGKLNGHLMAGLYPACPRAGENHQNGGKGDHQKQQQSSGHEIGKAGVHHHIGSISEHQKQSKHPDHQEKMRAEPAHHDKNTKGDSKPGHATEKTQAQTKEKQEKAEGKDAKHDTQKDAPNFGKTLGQIEKAFAQAGPHAAEDFAKMWQNWKIGCDGPDKKGEKDRSVSNDFQGMKAFVYELQKDPAAAIRVFGQERGEQLNEFAKVLGNIMMHGDKIVPQLINKVCQTFAEAKNNPMQMAKDLEKWLVTIPGMIPRADEEALKGLTTEGLIGHMPEGVFKDIIDQGSHLNDRIDQLHKFNKGAKSLIAKADAGEHHHPEGSKTADTHPQHHRRNDGQKDGYSEIAYLLPTQDTLPVLEIYDSGRLVAS